MGNYEVIVEAGSTLVKLLRRELVPDILPNGESIGLVSPADRGDTILCVHLYDMSESGVYRVSGMQPDGEDRQKFPPIHLTLFYMITAFSSSDAKFRSQEEQRILGRVAQVLRDYPLLNPETMEFVSGSAGENVHIEMEKIGSEEKLKMWAFPNLAPKLSLFYRMGPVPLESAKTKSIRRVQEMEFKTDYSWEESVENEIHDNRAKKKGIFGFISRR